MGGCFWRAALLWYLYVINIPAQKAEAQEGARIFEAVGDSDGTPRALAPPRKRAQTPYGINNELRAAGLISHTRMLAKRYRLPATFFKSRPEVWPEKKENDFFVVRRYRSGRAHSRFAVVVSKKIAPRAVARGRVRRAIYEYLRVSGAWARPGADVVVIVKLPMVGTSRQIRDALARKGRDLV